MANARSLAQGDKGTVFVGSRLLDKVYAIVNKDGKRSVKVHRLRPLPAQRRRIQGRHALHRRAVEDIQDRQDRGQPRQSAEADGDLRQAAEGRSPRLEVHRHRARQQALRPGRAARQQRAARRRSWPDQPDESRRQRRRSHRARRSQHGRLRLESGNQAALFHRQRPRLDVGRRARRTNSTASPRSASISARPIASRAISSTPNSVGANPAANSRHRSACWARIRLRSACGSTPATCSRRPTRTPSSSPATVRGTGRRKLAATSLSPS